MRHYETLMKAKYHLEICERLLQGYKTSDNKRYLVGLIRELAKATSQLITATLQYEQIGTKNSQKNLELFMNKVGPQYLEEKSLEHLYKILEIERAQKESPIEFTKKDTIILLIKGTYRFLRTSRLEEFFETTKKSVTRTGKIFRQI